MIDKPAACWAWMLALLGGAAGATDATAPMPTAPTAVVGQRAEIALSPASALSLALDHEARHQAAKATLRSERQTIDLARSGLMPSVSVSANRTHNQLSAGAGPRQDYMSSTTGVSLRQAVYRPEVQAQLEQAHAEVARQEALLDVDRIRLGTEVVTAYVEVLRTQAEWQAQQSLQRSLEGWVAAAQRAQPLGLGSASMVQERQAKAAQGRLRMLQAQLKRGEALAQLEMIVGRPVRIMLSLPDRGFAGSMGVATPLADWQQRAREHSPEVKAAQLGIRAAQLAVARVGAARLPTLDLVAGRNRVTSETPTTINNRYLNTAVGLQLAVPLYDGGRNNAAVAQAAADVERATARLDGAQRELDAQVESAYVLLGQAEERLQAHQVIVRSAEQAALAAREGQARGQQSALDVLDAQSQLDAALQDQRTTQLQLLQTRLRLHVLAGDEAWQTLEPLGRWLVQATPVSR